MIAGRVDFAVDNLPDTSGILAIVAISIGFIGLVFSIWSCYKIRTVRLPVLLLHQVHSTAASTIKPTISFIYHQSKDDTPATSIKENIYATFSTPWPYVSLSILTTILVIECITNLWQKFQRSQKTSLHLELTTGPTCELFTLLTLPLCLHNWNIQTPQDISSIHITTSYFILHYLHIQCTDFTITNTHTNRSINVPTTILISPFTARKIRNILQHPYTAYFLLSHHQYFQSFYILANVWSGHDLCVYISVSFCLPLESFIIFECKHFEYHNVFDDQQIIFYTMRCVHHYFFSFIPVLYLITCVFICVHVYMCIFYFSICNVDL